MLSKIERLSNSAAPWNTNPYRVRTPASCRSVSPESDFPSKRISPAEGLTRPMSVFRRTVLPQPLSPRITTVSALPIERLMSRSTCWLPKRTET